ncbi:hypothetical protein PRIPAC_86055 [Pristionchus pacificus]|uniref:Uncharacterized protein n=1 Tax=Pristionchus pacificus TaxID=54126 RepID=A0A2A6BN70_PRIPA|nr:hypothetical protein PRIPAC_86055 [Pristionchus pacificus]|eukprot:PDM67278.1 hypothetical protein PRIPAC_48695 [Pristionchus pacificus]
MEWQFCGILNYCLVHTGCFNPIPPGKTAGWILFKNMGNYSHPKQMENYQKDIGGQCERYITISPVENSEARKVTIIMVDKYGNSVEGLHLALGPTTLKLSCQPRRVSVSPSPIPGFIFEEDNTFGNDDNKLACKFTLEVNDDTDIRKKLTTTAGGAFTVDSRITTKGSMSVSGKEGGTDGAAYTSKIEDVDLTTLKILCRYDRVDRLSKPNAVDRTEFQAVPEAELLLPNPKYKGQTDREAPKAFEDDDRIQCPADAPMQYKKNAASMDTVWKLLKDGLVCRRGVLTLAGDAKKVVESKDQIKCARKKCGVCEAPPKMDGHGTNTPVFDEAKEGGCRTLKCDRPYIVIKMKDSSEIKLHPHSLIACSSDQKLSPNGNQTNTKNWELDEKNGELAEASCTTGIFCKQLNPVRTEPCESSNATCQEAQILEVYDEGRGACPVGFDVVYVVPGQGNQITLNTFKCDNSTGKWNATHSQNGKVPIVDDALIRCKKSKEPENRNEKIFLGMTVLEVGCFAAGLFLVVVAVIVAATFYVCMVKKRKAAKKKAMESVSVTFKEPPKYGKGKNGSKRDRKERQVSVMNSLTGSMSGPASGGGSSTPIAPPSQLLPPGKRVSKPDKGCAVLDINTGESKQMKWTNHAGDGPPTQRRELEAARKKAQTKKKKEKSRQNSIEYNLGDPRQVKIDKSNANSQFRLFEHEELTRCDLSGGRE